MRLSIAGVQNKTTIYINDNEYYIPNFHYPSTHILKFENSYHSNVLLNEYFCTKLANTLNIETSFLEYINQDEFKYLKIKRFDRKRVDDKIERIHMEDFAQIAGVLSSNKYESEGGPSFKRIVELLRMHSDNKIIDILLVAITLVFNFLIGNNDYHAKNFSVINEPIYKLTPLYDLLSTTVYEDLSTDMAMKINNKRDSLKIDRNDIIKEFDSWSLKGKYILNEIIKDFKDILVNANELIETDEFKNDKIFLNKIVNIINENFNKLTI